MSEANSSLTIKKLQIIQLLGSWRVPLPALYAVHKYR